MAYTPPAGNALDFSFVGALAYTPPAGGAVLFSFAAADATIDIAATIPVAATQDAAHGVNLDSVASVSVTADMALEHTSIDVEITLLATVPVTTAFDLAHGVAANSVASIPVTAELAAAHGVSVAASAIIAVTALQNIAHGVALDGIASVALTAAASIEVKRYELRGEVRLGGVLVNRRVRAYQRASGALIGEVDTVIGKFAVHAGFEPMECYITPIDLAEGATDWSPPTANRIMSVLALDTA